MTALADRMRSLEETRDPTSKLRSMLLSRTAKDSGEKLGLAKGERGESGYTPIKGKDYFTSAEVESIIKEVTRRVLIEKKGEPGRNGRDGIGVKGERGAQGPAPVKGKDYWTPSEQAAIITQVLKFIPKPGKAPTAQEIASEVKKTPVKYHEVEGAPDLKDLPALIAFLKAGGFRGGGGSSSSSSVTVYAETPSGLINGVNTTYTTAHTVTNVYSFAINGQFLHPVSDYSVSGTTITMVTALPAALSGLPFTIIYS